ncbi:MAG: hypothetical protein RBQ97_01325 [Acholeplasma sp.]|nr:hypothetical protein [Acholeplasma sp.]
MYKISATERNNEKSADFETRSLFHLLNYHADSSEIHFFVVDFFNDVSGVDRYSNRIWDIQSKGKFVTATLLGNCLITLFKNYVSDFSSNFVSYILYVESISSRILIDKTILNFGIENVKSKEIKKVKQGLLDEAQSRTYIKEYGLSQEVLENKINEFLEIVTFVIDSKSKSELIKDAITVDSSIYPSDSYLNNIFKQIRDIQASKKLTSTEGEILVSVYDFLKYSKYINAGQIILLITSRLINMDLTNDNKVPLSFVPYVRLKDEKEAKDFLEECRNDIYRMIFDKNNVSNYWMFFENVWKTVKDNLTCDIDALFNKLNMKVYNLVPLDINSIKFFIALVKDGMRK